MKGKYIGGIILLIIAIGIVYAGWSIQLNSWLVGFLGSAIGFLLGGPIGAIIGFLGGAIVATIAVKIFASILALWTAILAVMMISLDEEKTLAIFGLWLFSTLLIIFLIIPGPLPFGIAEITTGIGTFVSVVKTVANDNGGSKELEVF